MFSCVCGFACIINKEHSEIIYLTHYLGLKLYLLVPEGNLNDIYFTGAKVMPIKYSTATKGGAI